MYQKLNEKNCIKKYIFNILSKIKFILINQFHLFKILIFFLVFIVASIFDYSPTFKIVILFL